MASIAIQIEVDAQGAITGFRQVQGAGQQMAGGLERSGQQGNVVFTKLRKQTEQARDSVNLLSNSLGVQVPRALEKVIAQSRILGPVMASAFGIGVIAIFAGALINLVGGAIVKVIEHLNAFQDRLNQLEVENARFGNKIIEGSIERARRFRLEAAMAGADEIQRIEIEADQARAEIHRQLQIAVDKSDVAAVRALHAERVALEEAMAAKIAAIHERRQKESDRKAFESAIKNLEAMIEAERRVAEAFAKANASARDKVRELQDASVQAVISSLEGEARVRAELELKSALLLEIREKYRGFPEVVRAATDAEIVLQQQAADQIAKIRAAQNEKMVREWEAAVDRMASDLRSFFRDPLGFLLRQFEEFASKIAATFLLRLRGVGGAAGGGGGLFGSLFGGLFGAGGSGGGAGGFGSFLRGIFGLGSAGAAPAAAAGFVVPPSSRNLLTMPSLSGGGGLAAGFVVPPSSRNLLTMPSLSGGGQAATGLLASLGGAAGITTLGLSLAIPILTGIFEREALLAQGRRQLGETLRAQGGFEQQFLGHEIDFRSFATQSRGASEAIPKLDLFLPFRQQAWERFAKGWIQNAQLEIARRERRKLIGELRAPEDTGAPARAEGATVVIRNLTLTGATARTVIAEINRGLVGHGRQPLPI